jgi:hypothetical protein
MTGGTATAPVRVQSRDGRSTDATNAVAWVPAKDLDVREWVLAGQRLGAMNRCSQWWLGDWIRYGTSRWGEKYKEAARITGYDVQTLRNIAYVAGQIEISRRRDNLTWSHHAEVCALEADEQERWLDLAADQRMSVADLRIELRSSRRGEGDAESREKAAGSLVTCPECEHQFKPAK